MPQSAVDADKVIKDMLEKATRARKIAEEIHGIASGKLVESVHASTSNPDPDQLPSHQLASGIETVAQGHQQLREDFEVFKRKTARDIADVRRQTSNFVLRFTGKALPLRSLPQEKLLDKLDDLCDEKWGVRLTKEERESNEVKNLHFAFGLSRWSTSAR